MSKEQAIWRCKKATYKILPKEDFEQVLRGDVKIIRLKRDVLIQEADAMSVTFGMFNFNLPELVFVNGPSSDPEFSDAHFDIVQVEKEVSEAMQFIIETKTMPDFGKVLSMESGVGYLRTDYRWVDSRVESDRDLFIEQNLFCTVSVKNTLNVDFALFYRVADRAGIKLSMN